ncbi:hypothetical protein ABEF95_005731 [Exophiala dermatitidis]
MSSTTTVATPTSAQITPSLTLAATLADYELHHSDSPTQASSSEGRVLARVSDPGNTPTWDTTHRRVPSYRPINRSRDPRETRVYNNPAERVFISVMFTGVFINATAAKIWRRTFGRIDGGMFRYRIGGEI